MTPAPIRLLRQWSLCALLVGLGSAPGEAQSPPRLDVIQADALIRAVFTLQDADRYDSASDAYLGLLSALGGPTDAETEAVLLRHLHQLSPILPVPERVALHLDEVLAAESLRELPSGAGVRLVQWWRDQDDQPATPTNERLAEHLARVSYALTVFDSRRDASGYDGRGVVYVRLGPPDERFEISVSPSVVAFDLEVPRSWTRVPDNELWVYRSIRKGLHYLFVRPSARRPFRQGVASDLVPPPLRSAGQGRGRLDALLLVMEEIYGQLAIRDPAYGPVFDQIQGLIGGGSVADGAPAALAQTLIHSAETEDADIQGARASLAPLTHSRTRDDSDPLEAALRWARFRQPDGTTLLSVQWGLSDASYLRPSRRLAARLVESGLDVTDDAWVSVSVARLHRDGAPDVQHAHQYVELATGGAVTETVEIPMAASSNRIAVQWQARLSRTNGDDEPEPAQRTKLGTRRLPRLDPLPADGFALSDLQPLASSPGNVEARAHPFDWLPSDQLILAFEVYGLELGDTGQARIRVEYQIAEVGGSERTSSAYEYTTDVATSRELIEIDVSAYRGLAVEITVRVQDLVAGTVLERSLTFSGR